MNDLNKSENVEYCMSCHLPPMIGSATILTGTVSQVVLTLWRDIPGMRRCQEWTSEFIDMVKQGLLSESVLEVCDAIRAACVVPQAA